MAMRFSFGRRQASEATLRIGARTVGAKDDAPLVIAEIGINHEGDIDKAIRMVEDAAAAGAECVKFQSHVVDDEMIPNDVIPANADESIWDIMVRCALNEDEERQIKAVRRVQGHDLPQHAVLAGRGVAARERLGVEAYKIGSGECNNYPLVRHIASYGKPVILSTGMNDIASIEPAVTILRRAGVPFALLHCTSMYPTPYDKVRLGAIPALRERFPDAVIGLSDHSIGNYTCFAAVALGASILEKHFTSDKTWPGPDVPISIDPEGCGADRGLARDPRRPRRHEGHPSRGAADDRLRLRLRGDHPRHRRRRALDGDNIWVKRPGTGEILAAEYEALLGKVARRAIAGTSRSAGRTLPEQARGVQGLTQLTAVVTGAAGFLGSSLTAR